jgi:hypothetical protein
LIHVGLPKTATTSLQFGAFPCHPDIRYLGKPYYDPSIEYSGSLATAELLDSLWKHDEIEFNPELAQLRFDIGIRPRLSETLLAVLSEEGLACASAADRSLTARRLSELCKELDCSILITVREHKRALFSLHQWYFTRRFTSLNFDDWILWCRSYSSYFGRCNDFPLRQYCYSQLVDTYINIFGREKVLVLPMEILSTDQNRFYSMLEDFAGIRRFWGGQVLPVENRSPGRIGIHYQRLTKLIKFTYEQIRYGSSTYSEALETGFPHDVVMSLISKIDMPPRAMSKKTADWLDEYYKEDISRLKSSVGLDMGVYL